MFFRSSEPKNRPFLQNCRAFSLFGAEESTTFVVLHLHRVDVVWVLTHAVLLKVVNLGEAIGGVMESVLGGC